MDELFLFYLGAHCPPEMTPAQVCNEVRIKTRTQAPEAWRAIVSFYERHLGFGQEFFAWQLGIDEREFANAVQYYKRIAPV